MRLQPLITYYLDEQECYEWIGGFACFTARFNDRGLVFLSKESAVSCAAMNLPKAQALQTHVDRHDESHSDSENNSGFLLLYKNECDDGQPAQQIRFER